MKKLILSLAITAMFSAMPTYAYADTAISAMPEMTASDDDVLIGQEDGETVWNKIKLSAIRAFVLLGNAATATSLAANGANCSSGSSPLGVDASGASEACFDVWTEAENTSAAYAPLASPVFTGVLTLPSAANPTTDADGEIAFDLDAWGSGYDGLEIWNGTNSAYVVAIDAADTCTNGQVAKFNTAGNWTCENDTGGGTGAPTDVDYLVGTANGDLSAEIVVGTSPGGELGGTWASPTIDDGISITNLTLVTPVLGTPSSGTLTNATGLPTILVADTTDTTSSCAFFESETGELGPKTDAGCTYNANTGMLTATGFTGPLTGSSTDLNCTDCIGATEITDVYVLNTTDTMSTGADGSTVLTVGTTDVDQASDTKMVRVYTNDTNDTNTIFYEATTDDDGTPATDWRIKNTGTAGGIEQIWGSLGWTVTSDGDGAVTFLGRSTGADEDFTINLDDTTNEVDVSTSTGVLDWDFNGMDVNTDTLDLTGTGTINGLDVIDATGETTLESALDIGGEVTSTGMSSTVIADSVAVSSWTLTTPTISGAMTLNESGRLALDPAGSGDGAYSGITIAGTSGYAQAFGDVVYLDPTDSRWEAVDANAASGADGDGRGMIGMVVSTGTDGNPCIILLQGVIRADANFPALTINGPVYASETAGDITQTQPATTDAVIRVLGAALTADEIYFDPSKDYVTHI